MRESSVSFPSDKLILQGVCYFPEGDGVFPAAVLCHPHPLYGGSMYNDVILEIASALVSESVIVFMFNFRGVGSSEGSFGEGVSEQEDVKAAINWLVCQPEVDIDRVAVAGYSFGAAVAVPVACTDERIKAMVLVSPPLEMEQISQLKDCTKPKIVIYGSEDLVVSPQKVELVKREAAEPKQFEIVSGANHFWWRFETEMVEKIVTFFKSFVI